MIGIDEPTVQVAQVFCRIYLIWMWPTFASRATQSFLRAQGVRFCAGVLQISIEMAAF